MVGTAGIEPATPAMSTQYSTTELRAHTNGLSSGAARPAQPLILEAPPRRRLQTSDPLRGPYP